MNRLAQMQYPSVGGEPLVGRLPQRRDPAQVQPGPSIQGLSLVRGLMEGRDVNGELLARHVHGPSVDDLVLSELNGTVYYYHHDHLNSTIALTDATGNVVEQYRYDVYGQPSFYGPDGTPRAESALGLCFLFTGREWLYSLALYDYRHRAYSPSLGRFLQMDPLGFAAEDVNLYHGFANSPQILLDPFGLQEIRPENNFYQKWRAERARKNFMRRANAIVDSIILPRNNKLYRLTRLYEEYKQYQRVRELYELYLQRLDTPPQFEDAIKVWEQTHGATTGAANILRMTPQYQDVMKQYEDYLKQRRHSIGSDPLPLRDLDKEEEDKRRRRWWW